MYEEESKKSLIKTLLTALLFAVGIFIISSYIFRSCRMKDIDLADDVMFTKEVKDVYDVSPKDFKVYSYGLEKRFESVEANQLLQLKYMYYIPEAKQMQLTIKYRTSYAKAPTKDFIPFDFVLKNEVGERIDDFTYKCGEKGGYGYIRVAYNGINFTEKSEYSLTINQDVGGEIKERGKFLLQKGDSKYNELELTKDNAPYIFRKK